MNRLHTPATALLLGRAAASSQTGMDEIALNTLIRSTFKITNSEGLCLEISNDKGATAHPLNRDSVQS